MTQIHYCEVICNADYKTELLDDDSIFDLAHFSSACGQPTTWVLQLLEFDILPTRSAEAHLFLAEDLLRARRAYRLQRDFDASFAAVAMMLDLIDEVQKLRRKMPA
ncbi:chaperone modulator CbpM [Acinetobacter sp. MD2(2019)]|uniref:chaperone modulator CbpM n=1 Tax=Acinetobacter sp. MD2(2019) TaxID=2605273 RepID=UPI002D1F49ED|nr:chaperone modulator CbpM [Acinetobacter sp. MD2(2019)]MEB3753536.1 MerR family transcriptional regulator [Acinetobacter sp. MD2(2019)]